jgi:hypothetical protein
MSSSRNELVENNREFVGSVHFILTSTIKIAMPFGMTNGSPCVAQLDFEKLVIWDGNHTGLSWKHLNGHNPIQRTKSRFVSTLSLIIHACSPSVVLVL